MYEFRIIIKPGFSSRSLLKWFVFISTGPLAFSIKTYIRHIDGSSNGGDPRTGSWEAGQELSDVGDLVLAVRKIGGSNSGVAR